MAEKYRYAEVVFYPKNMVSNWKFIIDDVLQIPFCYAIHDQDTEEDGTPVEEHGHCCMVWNNTVSLDHFVKWFNQLSDPTKTFDKDIVDKDTGLVHTVSLPVKACSTAKPIVNWDRAFEYLIHNTEKAIQENKFQYPQSSRVCGNNFDIHHYRQLDEQIKLDILKEISDYIDKYNIMDFITLKRNFLDHQSQSYFQVAVTRSGYLDRLMAGNWKKWERDKLEKKK